MHQPLHKQGMKILPLIFVRLRQPLRHSITMQIEDKRKAVQTVVGLHGAGTVVMTALHMQHLIDGFPYLDAKRQKLLVGLVNIMALMQEEIHFWKFPKYLRPSCPLTHDTGNVPGSATPQVAATSSSTEICLFLFQGLCLLSQLKVMCAPFLFFSTALFVAHRASLCAYAL